MATRSRFRTSPTIALIAVALAVSGCTRDADTVDNPPELASPTASETEVETGVEDAGAQRLVHIVGVDPGPGFQVTHEGDAGPATLHLESGEQLQLSADATLSSYCTLLLPPGSFQDDPVPCRGIAHLADDGTVTRIHMFAVARDHGVVRTVAITPNVTIREGTVVLWDGTRLEPAATLDVVCAPWTAEQLAAGVEMSAFIEVDDAGRATLVECHAEF